MELKFILEKKKEFLANEIFNLMKNKEEDQIKLKNEFKVSKPMQLHKEFDWVYLENRYKQLYGEYNNRGKIKNYHENLKKEGDKEYVV